MGLVLLAGALLFGLLAGGIVALGRRGGRRRRWTLYAAAPPALLAALLLVAGAYTHWYFHRSQPADVQARPLFTGVAYHRESLTDPRPIVLHRVNIDLDAPGIGFAFTPPDRGGGRAYRAATVSEFLESSGAQIAVNASFYSPFIDERFYSYPKSGDPVGVQGLTLYEGEQLAPPMGDCAPIYFEEGPPRVRIDGPVNGARNAFAGRPMLVERGEIAGRLRDFGGEEALHPRTALALDATSRTLMLFVVDGRQPNFSEGVGLRELAEMILARGGWTAINLDGGGSTALVVEGRWGWPRVLNSPIHRRMPGRQRPVANHLGILAGAAGLPGE
jgi:hypothetical protein